MLVLFMKKNRLSPLKAKRYVVQFVLQKKRLLSTHQSAIREAPTVFSRLPSLMAAAKPCPQLQHSLKGALNPGQNLNAGKHQMTSGFLQNPL